RPSRSSNRNLAAALPIRKQPEGVRKSPVPLTASTPSTRLLPCSFCENIWLRPPSPGRAHSLRALLIVVVIALLAAAGVAGYLWYSIEKPYGALPQEGVFVEIPHGASLRGASHILEQHGVVPSAIAFELYARRHPKRKMVAGEYFFDHP